jgi:hypothetical protein
MKQNRLASGACRWKGLYKMLPDKSKGAPNYSRRPYPRLYAFLIVEVNAHLASANEARSVGNHKKFVEELKNACDVLDEFHLLFNELKDSPPVSRLPSYQVHNDV